MLWEFERTSGRCEMSFEDSLFFDVDCFDSVWVVVFSFSCLVPATSTL